MELQRLIDRGAVSGRLHATEDAEPKLEAHHRARVNSEQPVGVAAEAALREVLVEAVRQLEGAAVARQDKGSRHVDQTIIRFRQPQHRIVRRLDSGGAAAAGSS